MDARPIRHVPLVGDVAAGTGVLAQENIEELYPLPEDFTGTGSLFMLSVRGGISKWSTPASWTATSSSLASSLRPSRATSCGGPASPTAKATVKRFSTRDGKVVLTPANERLSPMEFDPDEITIFGKVVTVLRRL